MSWSQENISIALKSTPSLLFNNLCENDGLLAFAHNSEVNLVKNGVNPPHTVKVQQKERNPIFQVKLMTISGKELVVLTTAGGFQIWDCAASKMIYSFAISSEIESNDETYAFCRGIIALSNRQEFAVGCSLGQIFLFRVEADSVIVDQILRGHKQPIISLAYTTDLLVSADADGTIITWDASNKFSLEKRIVGDTYPVTSLAINVSGEFIVASYSTGHIRVFRAHTGNVALEIAAHSRSINAIAIQNNFVASVGEDSFLYVWSLPDFETKSSCEATLVFSAQVPDHIFTGVCFLDNGSIVTACYDTEVLRMWTME